MLADLGAHAFHKYPVLNFFIRAQAGRLPEFRDHTFRTFAQVDAYAPGELLRFLAAMNDLAEHFRPAGAPPDCGSRK